MRQSIPTRLEHIVTELLHRLNGHAGALFLTATDARSFAQSLRRCAALLKKSWRGPIWMPAVGRVASRGSTCGIAWHRVAVMLGDDSVPAPCALLHAGDCSERR
jgi:hypothetical protein